MNRMPPARRAIAAKTAKTGQEKGACAGWLATNGGNEKNPSGNPRHAPPASGRAARSTNANRMGTRLLTLSTYHVAGNAKGPAGTAGPAGARAGLNPASSPSWRRGSA